MAADMEQSLEDEMQKIYLYHPSHDLFDNKYKSHIIEINNIIENACYQQSLHIYQRGSYRTLRQFIIEMNEPTMDKLKYVAEKNFIHMMNVTSDDDGEDYNEDEKGGDERDAENWYLANNRDKVNVAKKHAAATVARET